MQVTNRGTTWNRGHWNPFHFFAMEVQTNHLYIWEREPQLLKGLVCQRHTKKWEIIHMTYGYPYRVTPTTITWNSSLFIGRQRQGDKILKAHHYQNTCSLPANEKEGNTVRLSKQGSFSFSKEKPLDRLTKEVNFWKAATNRLLTFWLFQNR